MKVAVVGSGIAGLMSAYLLDKKYEVTVFEADNWVGGHTHTVPVTEDNQTLWIDTGFIVCNPKNYHYFFPFLEHIGVPLQKTKMSFSVQVEENGLEYSGTSINGLFSQRKNLWNKDFLKMLKDIMKFNRAAKALVNQEPSSLTLKDFIAPLNLHRYSYEYYLIPMISAIWSCDFSRIQEIPAWFLCKFLDNHGLLNINDRPQWYTVVGGSHEYVKKITASLKQPVHTNTTVQSIKRHEHGVALTTTTETLHFDKVVVATHSDQALKLLTDISEKELSVLGNIAYQDNEVVLHTDTRLLPTAKRAWASWNYFLPKNADTDLCVTYNMNILQNLKCKQTYCVSLNQTEMIDKSKIIDTYHYAHPVFDMDATRAQERYAEISGHNHTYFCGAYWGYGFHEDGVKSAIQAVLQIDKDILCEVPFIKA